MYLSILIKIGTINKESQSSGAGQDRAEGGGPQVSLAGILDNDGREIKYFG